MSIKIFGQEQQQRAVELGLGISSPDQVGLVTGDASSRQYATALQGILANG